MDEHGRARKPESIKKQKIRRGGLKHKPKKVKFSLLGNNSAGLKSKKDSLEAIIRTLKNPSCITLQETKLAKNANFQLANYQVFQKNRNGSGGGLLTAIDPNLNPMLIASKNEEAEILTVQIELNKNKLRIINGYGPQDDDTQQNRFNFWSGLEEEIISAKSESCMIIIQMDANAKVGRNVISSDPNNVTDGNGRQLLEILDRQGLILLNADKKCIGSITRYRVTRNKTETAILDYMLVCNELYHYLEDIKIDEARQFTLTKYATTKGKVKKIQSDHNTMFANFCITYEKARKSKNRREIFNLKNPENQARFFKATNEGVQFQKCFDGNSSLEFKSNRFIKTLDDVLHKCFTKIRIKSGVKKDEISDLIQRKTEMSVSLPAVQCKLAREIISSQIQKTEDDISRLSSSRNAAIVRDYVKNLDSESENFSQLGLWKLKQELWQTQVDPPTAKRDANGTLITSPNLLKKLYLDTYTDRLRNRDMKTDLLDLFSLKSELWESRIEELRASPSKVWTMEDLDKVLKNLKSNKTRDPHGLINEIFKPGVIGEDLKKGILELFNGSKSELLIPMFLQYANITTIYKKKGSRQDMNNDRGIFVVSVLRMILDSLIYEDKYKNLDENMFNSNVGARKQRNIRDHLFIVYGVINSVLNGEGEPIDIQIYDVEKCFDALWLEDCMLDMFDTLPPESRDDKLALLYKLNMENYVAVNTAVGLTDRVELPTLVMQGGKWGPLQCSLTMDKIGKYCVDKGKHLYSYKGQVKVMPLAMVDDLLGMARCGAESADLNIMANSKIEMKKLRFHIPDEQGKSKCHTLHIGKNSKECIPLQVHGTLMEVVKNDTYLGDILTNDGKNKLNIEARVAKGLGIVSQIMDILKSVSFGAHYFEIATTLRESIMINGMLTNCEVWYGLTESEVCMLEEVDRLLLRRILNVASSCPVEALYLELGCVPIRIVIKSRRINYLHHLTTRETKK